MYALAALNIEYRRFGFSFTEEANAAHSTIKKPSIAELAARISEGGQ